MTPPVGKSIGQKLRESLTVKNIVLIVIFVTMVALFIYAAGSGFLPRFSNFVASTGYVGYLVIFPLATMAVGLPFGWGWSALNISCGFCYGWWGLLIMAISGQLSGVFNFLFIRLLARNNYLERHIEDLHPKTKKLLIKLQDVVTQDVLIGYPILIGLRVSPYPFGLHHATMALTDISLLRFYLVLLVGISIESPVLVNTGVILRDAGDLVTSENSDTKTLNIILLSISIVGTFMMVLLTSWYGRRIYRQLDLDKVIEVGAESVKDTKPVE